MFAMNRDMRIFTWVGQRSLASKFITSRTEGQPLWFTWKGLRVAMSSSPD